MSQIFKSDERFVPVPLSLIEDPALNAYHLATYVAIRKHADFGKETGSFVSDQAGADLAGMSRRKFVDCRKDLKNAGWLEWTGSEGRRNHYIVRSKRTAPPDDRASTHAPGAQVATTPAPAAQVGVHDVRAPYAPGAHDLETPTETSSTETSGSSDELPAGPDEFTPNNLVEIVVEVGLRGHRPPNWGKQHKAAARLVSDYGMDCDAIVREACRGMLLLFPWGLPPLGRRTPFDVFTLERKLPEALVAAVDDKPPSDIVEKTHVLTLRGGGPVSLGSLVEGVLERARKRKAS